MAGAKAPSSTSTCSTSPPSSPWHSCKHPRTHSFRKVDYHKGHHRDLNSLSSGSSEASAADVDVEVVIRGLKSDDRLFFEPAGGSRSVVDRRERRDHAVLAAASTTTVPFEGSIAMAVDSMDPYLDFKVSMAEMVMAHGVKDWEWMEEMLLWYLKMNGKRTHRIIVDAFSDLFLTALASSSSRSSFSFEVEVEVEDEDEDEDENG
ncbi:hypothetical protein Cni_G27593 [Canna indica]|uniref:Transcription repressor n=1 Tax=Canna indica TaxID=4628 RepID=A0AAQ3QRJ4_9LILI|nr:hypothetical protein Cni_G27593 [Canna indica]